MFSGEPTNCELYRFRIHNEESQASEFFRYLPEANYEVTEHNEKKFSICLHCKAEKNKDSKQRWFCEICLEKWKEFSAKNERVVKNLLDIIRNSLYHD